MAQIKDLAVGDKFRYVEGDDLGIVHTVTEQNDVRAFVRAEIGLNFNPVQCVDGETRVEKIQQEQTSGLC
jgi:hypothetical protein